MPKGIPKKGINKGWIKKGAKFSGETKEKMSLSKKGKRPHNFSIECRKKMSEAKRGIKNHCWKGGVVSINSQLRKSLEYRIWRKAVFERDNYTCRFCNRKGLKLNADHIKSWRDYPELRFAIDNGRTLCVDCHKKTESWGKWK